VKSFPFSLPSQGANIVQYCVALPRGKNEHCLLLYYLGACPEGLYFCIKKCATKQVGCANVDNTLSFVVDTIDDTS